jgi:hypothetical protein
MRESSDMRHILFRSKLADGRELCVSPVSRDAFDANKAESLGDDSGYFLYECDANRPLSGIEILAKAASADAAIRLFEIISMSSATQAVL